jgi:hypothetical protein
VFDIIGPGARYQFLGLLVNTCPEGRCLALLFARPAQDTPIGQARHVRLLFLWSTLLLVACVKAFVIAFKAFIFTGARRHVIRAGKARRPALEARVTLPCCFTACLRAAILSPVAALLLVAARVSMGAAGTALLVITRIVSPCGTRPGMRIAFLVPVRWPALLVGRTLVVVPGVSWSLVVGPATGGALTLAGFKGTRPFVAAWLTIIVAPLRAIIELAILPALE